MPLEFDVDPYDPYDPEERPSIGWSLRKRIIFGLIAILAILSMLGSAIAGVLWLAADDQRPPPTRPTPTPTPWWGPVVTAPDQAIITRSDHPAEPLLHTAEAAYATDTGILSISERATNAHGQRKQYISGDVVQFKQCFWIGYANVFQISQGFGGYDFAHYSS
jgi:hypothetical protein